MKLIWKQKLSKKKQRPRTPKRFWPRCPNTEDGNRKKNLKSLLLQKLHKRHLMRKKQPKVRPQKKTLQKPKLPRLLEKRLRMMRLKRRLQRKSRQTSPSLPFPKHNSIRHPTAMTTARKRICWHNCKPKSKTAARSERPHLKKRAPVFGRATPAMAQTLSLPLTSLSKIKVQCPTTTCLTTPPSAWPTSRAFNGRLPPDPRKRNLILPISSAPTACSK